MRAIKWVENVFLIVCLFFVTYQKLFADSALSYMDEVMLGLLLLLELFASRYKKYIPDRLRMIRYTVYAGIFYIIFSFVATVTGWFVFSTQQTNVEMFTAIINALKIYVLLLICVLLNFSADEVEKWIKVCLIMAIPSVIYSVVQYIQYYVLGIHLDGHYDIIDGVWYYRIQGFAYHPVGYGNQLALMVLMIVHLMKNKKHLIVKAVVAVAYSILCYLTRTKYSYVMLAISLVILMIAYSGHTIRQLAIMLSVGVAVFAIIALPIFKFNVFEWVFEGEESTIRYRSITGSLNLLLNQNPIGYGWGSYSYFGFGEAGIFRILFDSGILGVTAFLFPLIYQFIVQLKYKKTLFGIMVFLFCICNALINELYAIPGIYYVFLCTTDVGVGIQDPGKVNVRGRQKQ